MRSRFILNQFDTEKNILLKIGRYGEYSEWKEMFFGTKMHPNSKPNRRCSVYRGVKNVRNQKTNKITNLINDLCPLPKRNN